MATEVEIFNYKTIKHVKFTIDGYTLLLGKNFIGKSALITAIMSALVNRQGEGFIRNGERYTEVRIRHGKYHIVWHKEKGNNYYVVSDGKNVNEYKKMKKNEVPPEINKMGFGSIEVSGEKTLLWYARQMEVLFLIDRPKTDYTTDIIASITNLDTVYKAQDLAKKDLRAAKAKLKIRSNDLIDAKREYSKYEGLKDFEELEERKEEILEDIGVLEEDIDFIRKSIIAVESNVASLKKVFPYRQTEHLDTGGLENSIKELDKLSSFSIAYQNLVDRYARMTPLVKELLKTKNASSIANSCQATIDELTTLSRLNSLWENASRRVEETSTCGNIPNASAQYSKTVEILKEVSSLGKLLSSFEKESSVVDKLSRCQVLREVKVTDTLVKDIKVLSDFESRVNALKEDITEAKSSLDKEKKNYEKVLEELGQFKECPTCGAEL